MSYLHSFQSVICGSNMTKSRYILTTAEIFTSAVAAPCALRHKIRQVTINLRFNFVKNTKVRKRNIKVKKYFKNFYFFCIIILLKSYICGKFWKFTVHFETFFNWEIAKQNKISVFIFWFISARNWILFCRIFYHIPISFSRQNKGRHFNHEQIRK